MNKTDTAVRDRLFWAAVFVIDVDFLCFSIEKMDNIWYNHNVSSAKAEIYSTIISFWSVFEWQLVIKNYGNS